MMMLSKREKKIRTAELIRRLSDEYQNILFADFYRVPADLMQRIRASLRGSAKILVSKKRIAEKALKDKKGFNNIGGLPRNLALIFTNENVFDIYSKISNMTTNVFARPGEIAESDIVIPKGPTDLMPGPVLNDLKAMGIPTKIKGGKVEIEEDTVVVKAGDLIPRHVAEVLRALKIAPIEVRLRIKAALDRDGVVYREDVLSTTEEEICRMVADASARAIVVAIELGELNERTANVLISRAYMNAINIAAEIGFITDKTAEMLLIKAIMRAKALSSYIS
ncbi:MAG: 50S ribosomal protein L10 [Candidatus Methanodesulfokora sp.]|jgi:large subunit ribosomal protein L10